MSKANYMLCLACNGKAYYDADTDYDDAEVAALCSICSQEWMLTIAKKVR